MSEDNREPKKNQRRESNGVDRSKHGDTLRTPVKTGPCTRRANKRNAEERVQLMLSELQSKKPKHAHTAAQGAADARAAWDKDMLLELDALCQSVMELIVERDILLNAAVGIRERNTRLENNLKKMQKNTKKIEDKTVSFQLDLKKQAVEKAMEKESSARDDEVPRRLMLAVKERDCLAKELANIMAERDKLRSTIHNLVQAGKK